jgi:L-lactate dehydrogenase complex protein LldG
MNDRDKILAAIKANQPALTPVPQILISTEKNKVERVREFTERLIGIGGQVVQSNIDLVRKKLLESIQGKEYAVNAVPEIGGTNSEILFTDTAVSLSKVDRFFIKSSLGVAENGAVWIQEKEMMNRLLPFICQHLIVVLNTNDIVSNMHEAYQKIRDTDAGFHVFIAGPSKTADIEQSLVIGAHGARSLTVHLIDL